MLNIMHMDSLNPQSNPIGRVLTRSYFFLQREKIRSMSTQLNSVLNQNMIYENEEERDEGWAWTWKP